jgi:DnaJ-class molecular chaperone
VRRKRDAHAENGTVTGLSRDLTAGMMQVMTDTTTTAPNSCLACRGRGWKLVLLRRSPANAGVTADRSTTSRRRATCLACQGTGRAATE